MAEDRVGWEIKGVFYPHKDLNTWKRRDIVLARTLTRLPIDDVMAGRHPEALDEALCAIAVWGARPELTMDQVIDFVLDLSVDDSRYVGPVTKEADTDGPPVEESTTTGETSSSTSAAPPEETGNETAAADATPETSNLPTSGTSRSAIGEDRPIRAA